MAIAKSHSHAIADLCVCLNCHRQVPLPCYCSSPCLLTLSSASPIAMLLQFPLFADIAIGKSHSHAIDRSPCLLTLMEPLFLALLYILLSMASLKMCASLLAWMLNCIPHLQMDFCSALMKLLVLCFDLIPINGAQCILSKFPLAAVESNLHNRN